MDEANRSERDHKVMGHPAGLLYLLHDRDTKYTQSFLAIIASGRVEPLALPARSLFWPYGLLQTVSHPGRASIVANLSAQVVGGMKRSQSAREVSIPRQLFVKLKGVS